MKWNTLRNFAHTTLTGMALATCLMLTGNMAQADDWAKWRGPNNNSISGETAWLTKLPASGPEKLWQTNIGKSYSAVVVSNNRLFTMGATGGKETIFGFDATTGKELWKLTYAHPKRESQADPNPTASASTPTIEGDRVYTISREGLAYCLDVSDGKVIWTHDFGADKKMTIPQFGFSGAPLIEGEKVLYNVGSNGAALEKATGKTLWISGTEGAGYSTPTIYQVGSQRAVAMFTTNGLAGVDIETGRRLWFYPWKTQYNTYAVDPIFVKDRLYLMTYGAAKQLRLSGRKLEQVYESRSMRCSYNNPVLIDGHLYGNDQGALKCMEWTTGKEKWRLAGMGSGSLIAAGKHLIVLNERGELSIVAVNSDTYTEISRAKVIEEKCWTHPVLANGLLYCRNNDGALVCLDLRLK